MNTIKYLWIIAIVGLSACGGQVKENTPAQAPTEAKDHRDSTIVTLTDEQVKTAGITLGKLEQRHISGTFRASGVLDVPPQQQVSISVPLGGFLKSTQLLQGMRVKRGQLLATIENPDYVQMQQDYLEARSQLEFAKADYDRQQELAKENVNAKKTLQQSASNFQTLTARVNGLKEKIKASGINFSAVEKGNIQSYINLYSPINGFVTKVNANIGKFVNATDELFEIVDTEHLHAELTVFEKDVPKLSIGQKIRFTLANENTERTAKVYLIGREISEDRTIRVHCHIDKEDIHLLPPPPPPPGMYLKAVIESGAHEVPVLPDAAIVDYLGNKYIFLQQAPGEFKMAPVVTGNSDEGFTEVTLKDSAVNNDASIVINGAYDLLAALRNTGDDDH